MVLIRIIKSVRDIVAICDSNLLGKTFEEGNIKLEVKESFFKGEEFNEEKSLEIIEDMLSEDATFYIVGKDSVDLSLRANAIQKQDIKEVQGIPFCLILL